MATERLSVRQTREILRQEWSLGRTHREVAQSLGISSGAVGTTVLRARAAGPDGASSKPGLQKRPPEQRAPGGEHTDGQHVAEQQMWHEGDRTPQVGGNPGARPGSNSRDRPIERGLYGRAPANGEE
jgi:hypothetical protein